MPETLFLEIGGVIFVAAVFSFLAFFLRQPLMIGYILAGLVLGPGILAYTHSPDVLEAFSTIGISFLLFTVGLGLNWRLIKEMGRTALIMGVGQVLFTGLLGFGLSTLLGFSFLTSVYLAVAFAFASTIIVVKLLMDKGDLDSLYGKIAVGFLLVQDVIAMLVLLVLDAVGHGNSLQQIFTGSLLKGVVVFLIVGFLTLRVVPRLIRHAARSQELLLLFSLGWCFAVSAILVRFGFTAELGALIAGVALSGTTYHREIEARIRPLRDFFLVLFFIVLGTHIHLETVSYLIVPLIAFSLLILVANPIIIMLLMRLLGYHPRSGFMAGTTVAQISEFSFIVLGTGVALGHIDASVVSLATMVGLVTIAASSYLVKYNDTLYHFLYPVLRHLERNLPAHESRAKHHASPRVLLCGYDQMGEILLPEIRKLRQKYVIIDFDPERIETLEEEDLPAVYGDAGDDRFLEELRPEEAKLIISTIPTFSVTLSFLEYLKRHHFSGVVIVTAKTAGEAEDCYSLGATYVILPRILGAKKFVDILEKNRMGKEAWVHFVEQRK